MAKKKPYYKKPKKKKKTKKVFVLKRNALLDTLLFYLRASRTKSGKFRSIVNSIATILFYEASRNFPTEVAEVKTPNGKFKFRRMKSVSKIFGVSILRGSEVMLNALFSYFCFADISIAHLGLARDEKTHMPKEYLPMKKLKGKRDYAIIFDIMLATSGSISYAIEILKKRGVKHIKIVCIIASREGVKEIMRKHPEVELYCGVIDPDLNDDAYIIPGLGDAGNRSFNTK